MNADIPDMPLTDIETVDLDGGDIAFAHNQCGDSEGFSIHYAGLGGASFNLAIERPQLLRVYNALGRLITRAGS